MVLEDVSILRPSAPPPEQFVQNLALRQRKETGFKMRSVPRATVLVVGLVGGSDGGAEGQILGVTKAI
jgi:hypothetical protein